MKFTIENIENNRARAVLYLNGEKYSEVWYKLKDGWVVDGSDILTQLEVEGIDLDTSDISEFIGSIDISAFMNSEKYLFSKTIEEQIFNKLIMASKEKRLEAILKSVEVIDITEDERKFLNWLSGCDPSIAKNFISIVEKLKL